MRGSRISNPTILAATTVAVGGSPASVLPVRAADIDWPPAPAQQPILFSLDTPAPASPGLGRGAGVIAPTKRPGTPVQRIPLDGKPLIPPAPSAAKLGPTPPPNPALSRETDPLPFTTLPTPSADASNPAAPKAPSS